VSEQPEVLVIGGGHNGLVSAAYLARAGLRTTLLEARPELGGLAGSEEAWPGFRVNVGADDAGLFLPNVYGELDLARHGLHFLEGEAAVFSPGPDGSGLTLWRDRERSLEEIGRHSAEDARRYMEFLDELDRFRAVLRPTLAQIPPDAQNRSLPELWPWMQVGLKLRRQGGPQMMNFLRTLPLSAREFLDEWFESTRLKAALAAPGLAGDMPGPYAAGTTYTMLYHQVGVENGGFRSSRFVRGGMGALIEALAAAFREQGGLIRTGARVELIELDRYNERVTGVRLEGGERLEATCIVSSADPRQTYLELVGGPHLPPSVTRAARNIRGPGMTVKVDLALDGLPDFGVEPAALTGHLLVADSLEYLERAWDDAKYGRISERPILDAVIPTLLDPSLAPDGRHLMAVTMMYAPYRDGDGTWAGTRERLADLVVETLAQLTPDLPQRVLQRRVSGPLDYRQAFGLTQGAGYHVQMALDQLMFMRPIPGYGRYRTPIQGLYLCGSGNHPGGGVTGAPGYNAARAVLHDR
jgi:phytoene dehydrogenase-like protein